MKIYIGKAVKLFMIAAFICLNVFSYAQTSQKVATSNSSDIENLLNAKTFVFVAESMNPMGGRNMFLTSFYNVIVNADEVQSNLPYFGRAYAAPIDPTKSALQFSSSSFSYKMEAARKDGWNIRIVPKDTRDVREMYLTVSSTGNAYLQVLSNNRQPISFNGRIEPLETE